MLTLSYNLAKMRADKHNPDFTQYLQGQSATDYFLEIPIGTKQEAWGLFYDLLQSH